MAQQRTRKKHAAELASLRAECQALKAQLAETLELVHNANSIILLWNKQGQITFANRFALRFFGYREDELLGRSVLETIVPAQDSAGSDLTTLIADLCRDPDRYINHENENMKKDGERVWVSWTNRPITDASGALVQLLSVGNDITRRKQAEEELWRQANYDPLTGALNRRAGLHALEQNLRLAHRQGRPLAVCYVDLDGLKRVNDTLGHAAGDRYIKTSTALLAEALRRSDQLCRLGGDELLVVLPDCSRAEAAAFWQRVEARITAHNQNISAEPPLGLSHGFAEYEGQSMPPRPEDLLAQADARMYYDKAQRQRNRGATSAPNPNQGGSTDGRS